MLKVGDVEFTDLAAPESFTLGGEQKIVTKQLPGGTVIYQPRGDFAELTNSWDGTFMSSDAFRKCQRLDEIRTAGKSVLVTFGSQSLYCYVNRFVWPWKNEQHIDFSITLLRDLVKEKSAKDQKSDPLAKFASPATQTAAPKKQPITHTVVAGESLWRIAQHYKSTVDRIFNDNRKVIGNNPSLILPGQRLVINT